MQGRLYQVVTQMYEVTGEVAMRARWYLYARKTQNRFESLLFLKEAFVACERTGRYMCGLFWNISTHRPPRPFFHIIIARIMCSYDRVICFPID